MRYCSNFFSGGHSMMRGGTFGMGIIWWGLLAVVIIGAIYFMKNRTTNHKTQLNTTSQPESIHQVVHPSAFDVLAEEFAKGTITEEEYLHKKEVLKK